MTSAAYSPSDRDIVATARLTAAERKRIERMAQAGQLARIYKGLYVLSTGSADDLARRVRANWPEVAGIVAPGGVISHVSAMAGGPTNDTIFVSHPTLRRRKVELPGLAVEIIPGSGPLPGDLPMSRTGIHYAGRTRVLLENLGRKAPRRAGEKEVEKRLVATLNASGEKSLNEIRDEAVTVAKSLGLEAEVEDLRRIIGALLGTYKRGALKTQEGILIAQGKPVDAERMSRFNLLAAHLRITPLPRVEERIPSGTPRHNFAFIESYFSNYVEGTKFAIEEARDIVMNNKLVTTRPKDSHDILGVFRMAVETDRKSVV